MGVTGYLLYSTPEAWHAWPKVDTSHSELNPELRRGVPAELERASLVSAKKETVWPGAQAREGRKQDDASWMDAAREVGSKKLYKVATNLYQLEILKGECGMSHLW